MAWHWRPALREPLERQVPREPRRALLRRRAPAPVRPLVLASALAPRPALLQRRVPLRERLPLQVQVRVRPVLWTPQALRALRGRPLQRPLLARRVRLPALARLRALR